MSTPYPPTIIVRHQAENPRKCSVYPLRGRPDLVFLPYPVVRRPPLEGYVRLAAEGPELSAADAGCGLLRPTRQERADSRRVGRGPRRAVGVGSGEDDCSDL